MTVLATETQKFSNTFKQLLWEDLKYNGDIFVANESAAKTYKVGDIVGQVTANKKVKLSVDTAVDGSQTVFGIVAEDKTVPANTDTKVRVIYRGPAVVNKAGLFFDASYDSTDKAAAYLVLDGKGIAVLDAV